MVYAQGQYDLRRPVPSYWEASAAPAAFPALEGSARCKVAVVGGGIDSGEHGRVVALPGTVATGCSAT